MVKVTESWASSPAVRKSMQGNKRRDTSIEMALRRELHRRGLRYKVDAKPLAGLNRRADLVFVSAKVAVFVHGCFWHGCRWHHKLPVTNSDYWAAKVAGNKARDASTRRALRAAGWHVVTLWEHQDFPAAADDVEAIVRLRLK